MKYLQDGDLARWTTALTEVPIGHSRMLNGRLEAYSMKRATSDKKYAAVLGEKYVEQIQQDQDSLAEPLTSNPSIKKFRGRRRSQSVGVLPEASRGDADEKSVKNAKNVAFSNGTPPLDEVLPKKRMRSCSLDEGYPIASFATALGDFNEQGTRRLMTDLVLTLNAAFPDYDFGSVKPSDFVKMHAKRASLKINESLSEWASTSTGSGNNIDLNQMWQDVDRAIVLNECDVYKFNPTEDSSFLLTSYEEDEDTESYEGSAVLDYGMSGAQSLQETILWAFTYLFVNKNMKRILLFACAESMRQQNGSLYSDEEEANKGQFVPFLNMDGRGTNVNFDLDPEANTAGGIPVSTI